MSADSAQSIIKQVTACGDDYYRILGVPRDAGDDAIKKAYRKLALRLHPDKCSERGAEEAFKKVGEAFSVLSDARKRQQYDQFGVDSVRSGGGGGPGPSPEDIFQAFFGGGMPAGATFMRTGPGGGGFQTFQFGPGGSGIHFTMGPGGFGGFPQGPRRRTTQRQDSSDEDERDSRPAEQELPSWAAALPAIAGALGPMLPLVVCGMMVFGMMMLGTIVQFVMTRAIYILPVLYLTDGNTRRTLLTLVVVLALFGVL